MFDVCVLFCFLTDVIPPYSESHCTTPTLDINSRDYCQELNIEQSKKLFEIIQVCFDIKTRRCCCPVQCSGNGSLSLQTGLVPACLPARPDKSISNISAQTKLDKLTGAAATTFRQPTNPGHNVAWSHGTSLPV